MRSRLVRILSVAFILFLYTTYKVFQLMPFHLFLAIAVSGSVFFSMLAGIFLLDSNELVFEKLWFKTFSWTSSLVMSLWATFMILSIPYDLFYLFIPYKDLFIPIFIIALVLVGGGFLAAMGGPRVKKTVVPVLHLNEDLVGLKIAQLSDMHVGPTIRKNAVKKMVHLTNETNPDFIFITGDIADAEVLAIAQHMEPLRSLKSKYGVFYVTGNHEYYWDAKGLIEKTRELGFIPLINENKIISIGSSKVLVAGISDPMGSEFSPDHKPNLQKAIESSETTELKILLSHRPEFCKGAEKVGFDFQFSGHTHGGQFFPITAIARFVHPYFRGLYRVGKLFLYVNQGSAYWGPANRLGVAPEITLLTLQKNGQKKV